MLNPIKTLLTLGIVAVAFPFPTAGSVIVALACCAFVWGWDN